MARSVCCVELVLANWATFDETAVERVGLLLLYHEEPTSSTPQ